MTVALSLVAATPHSLKYEYVYDGAGGAGSGAVVRNQAAIVADFANVAGPSPLKDFLSGIATDGAWDALEHSAKISLYATISLLVAATNLQAEFTIVSLARVLKVIGLDGNAGRGIIEIRFHHTFDR